MYTIQLHIIIIIIIIIHRHHHPLETANNLPSLLLTTNFDDKLYIAVIWWHKIQQQSKLKQLNLNVEILWRCRSYVAIFVTVKKSAAKISDSATNTADEYALAKKLVVIVATDFLCWVHMQISRPS